MLNLWDNSGARDVLNTPARPSPHATVKGGPRMAISQPITLDIAGEVWKLVPGYDGRYEASNLGRIRSILDKGHRRPVPVVMRQRLRGRRPGKEYAHIHYRASGTRSVTSRGVHRMVLLAFKGEPPLPGMECAHEDGNPLNNRLDNLSWKTPKGNADDKARHGVQPRGEQVVTAKLTADQVRGVLRSSEPHAVVATRLGLSAGYVFALRAGRWWRHIYNEVGGWIGKPQGITR